MEMAFSVRVLKCGTNTAFFIYKQKALFLEEIWYMGSEK